MNRLWVRLSLGFSAAAFISMMVMFTSLFVVRTGVPISLIIDELRAPGSVPHDVTYSVWGRTHAAEAGQEVMVDAGGHPVDGAIIAQQTSPVWNEEMTTVTDAIPAMPQNRVETVEIAPWASAQHTVPVPEQVYPAEAGSDAGATTLWMRAEAAVEQGMSPLLSPDTTMMLSLADANGQTVPGYEKGEVFGANQAYQVMMLKDKGGAFRFTRRFQMPVPGPFNIWINGLLNTMGSAAIIAGVVSVIFGVLMSRNLTAPLNRLAEVARAIEARKLHRRVRVEGTTEIAAVAQAFNDMADSVQHATTLRQSLVADVAHELRTPLSVLQGNLRAILDDVYPLSKQEISRLYDQTRLLSRLVNDLHELSQAEAHQLPLHPQSFDLAAMLHEQGSMFAALAEDEGLHMKIDAPASGVWIEADQSRLVQVLTNLMSNALAHTPSGGEIRVSLKSEMSGLMLIVSDTGEGIDAQHLPYLFERFYRADSGRSRSKGGAGLGLAIVRALVHEHGGTIEAASPGAGKGSTFTVRLPPALDAA